MTLDECKKVFERVSEGAVFDCIDKESYFQFDIIGGDNSESNFYLKFKDGHMSVHEGDYKERVKDYCGSSACVWQGNSMGAAV